MITNAPKTLCRPATRHETLDAWLLRQFRISLPRRFAAGSFCALRKMPARFSGRDSLPPFGTRSPSRHCGRRGCHLVT
jgi:hypothetical protein